MCQDIFLSTLCGLSYLILTTTLCILFLPLYKKGTWSLERLWYFAQSHIAKKWWSWDLNPVSLIPKSIFWTAKNYEFQITFLQPVHSRTNHSRDCACYFLPCYLVGIVQLFGPSEYLNQFNFRFGILTEETGFLLLSTQVCRTYGLLRVKPVLRKSSVKVIATYFMCPPPQPTLSLWEFLNSHFLVRARVVHLKMLSGKPGKVLCWPRLMRPSWH